MKIYYSLIIISIFINNTNVFAQNRLTHKESKKNISLIKKTDSLVKNNPDSAVVILNYWINNGKYAEYEFILTNEIGRIYKNKQDYTSAKKYYIKALNLVSNSGNSSFETDVLLELGRVSRRLGNYDQALQYDLKALKIAEAEENKKLYGLIYNYIGIDHYRYHNYKEAIVFFDKSIKAREESRDSIGIADCYVNLGAVYDEQGKLDKAFAKYQKALTIFTNLKELDGIASAYNNMAGIYYQKKDFPKVMEYMDKVMNIYRKEGDKRKLAFTLLNVASLYFATQDIEKSIQLSKEGLRLAKEVGAKSQKRIAYKALSDAYLFQKNYKKALDYRILYEKMKDSIFEENKTKTIAEMQTKYETEKKEIENQLLKTENEKKSRNQIFLISISAVLIALVLLLVYYLRLRSQNLHQQKELNKLQKEKYEAALEQKNQQLMNSTACLVNKNEVLGKLKVEIKAMKSDFKEKSEVISFINRNIDMDTDWKKFKMDFEEVHPGFFDRLNAAFPGLSETYQKIAAYLRIGLSTQEIADLLFITVTSAKKYRQRLRKKLNLDSNTDLSQFLMKV